MRGNITRRGKSSWRLKYDVGTGSERRIAYVTVRGTRKQAEAELAKRLTELAEGRYVPPTVETVESYARYWIADIALTSRAAITIERFRRCFVHTSFPALAQSNCRGWTARPSIASTLRVGKWAWRL